MVLEVLVVAVVVVCFDFVLSAQTVAVPVALKVVVVRSFAAGKGLAGILKLESRKERYHSLENWTLSDVPQVALVRYLVVGVEHTPEQVNHRFGGPYQSQNP